MSMLTSSLLIPYLVKPPCYSVCVTYSSVASGLLFFCNFVVFDFVSIWYLFSLFLTQYSMYPCILYMSPLYINMFLYLFQYFSVLYFLLHMIILCLSSFSKKTVFFLSWITCNVMHVYFVFQTMYLVQLYWNKFCSVLFLISKSLNSEWS